VKSIKTRMKSRFFDRSAEHDTLTTTPHDCQGESPANLSGAGLPARLQPAQKNPAWGRVSKFAENTFNPW